MGDDTDSIVLAFRYRWKPSCENITVKNSHLEMAVPWFMRLVAGHSPRRPGLDPVSVHVGFVVEKVDRFFPEYVGFPLSFSVHRCSITRKNEKKLIIFITGLHNKPQGCGALKKLFKQLDFFSHLLQ